MTKPICRLPDIHFEVERETNFDLKFTLIAFSMFCVLILGAVVAVGGERSRNFGYVPPDNQTIAVAVRNLEEKVQRLEKRIRTLERR